jgi:hypothetical protein
VGAGTTIGAGAAAAGLLKKPSKNDMVSERKKNNEKCSARQAQLRCPASKQKLFKNSIELMNSRGANLNCRLEAADTHIKNRLVASMSWKKLKISGNCPAARGGHTACVLRFFT